MKKRLFAYFQLHLAVILYGWTAILGALINLTAVNLVWWRVLITSFSLFVIIVIGYSQKLVQLSRKTLLLFCGIGSIVGMHWILFFSSIKLANASIALIAMATTSFFTSITEPFIIKAKINKLDIIVGILIIPFMIIIVKNIAFKHIVGFTVGLISAFLASLFSSLNKKYVEEASPYVISFLEMFGAFIFISIFLPFINTGMESMIPSWGDWTYILILSILCTTLAFVLSIMALKHISAFESNLAINLEPVYGIALAAIILNEQQDLSLMFYLGCILIMLIVFTHPFIKKKFYGRT